MNRISPKIFLSAGGLALLLGTSFILPPAFGRDAPPAKAQGIPVRVAPVVEKEVSYQIKAVGTVIPCQTVAVKSRLDSQIMAVKFHDGDLVKKGQVLFLLDDRVIKAQLLQAQANTQKDKAQLANLQRQYDRNNALVKQNAISQEAFDDSRAALDAQKAVVTADDAAAQNIRVQLDYTTITAPIDGRSGTINVTVGNTVKANDTISLVTINQIQPVRIQVALPESNFESLRKGMNAGPVVVSAASSDNKQVAQGQLEYIDNAIDQATGTFVTRALFPNADESLWPGMLATVTINLDQKTQALAIPEVAVQHGSEDFVYVISDGKAHKKPIKVLRLQDQQAFVGAGLQANDVVAVDGLMALQDGAAVSVVTPKDAVAPATTPATPAKTDK